MRIAIVHSYYSSTQPSGENFAVDLQAEALRQAGHQVELFSVTSDDEIGDAWELARTATRVATGFGRNPSRALTRFSPDVVHVHNLFPNFSQNWLLGWQGPVVATIHNYRTVCAAGSLFRDGRECDSCFMHGTQEAVRHRCYRNSAIATLPLAVATRSRGSRNAVLRRADKLIFLSARARSKLSGMQPSIASGSSEIVPNFVGVQPESPLDRRPGESWVYCGRLSPEKGASELVEAWASGQRLDIIGDGPDRLRIERAAAGKNIRVLGGVSPLEAGRLIAGAKGLVFPSLWEEPAPAMSYLQALSAGVPTIALEGNAVADDVAAHETGVVVSDLAQVNDWLSREDEVQHWGAHARQRFEHAFSKEAWLLRITQVYKELVP
ncbi:glycosyltransferase family 4 protein [Microbacterium endophyticum]